MPVKKLELEIFNIKYGFRKQVLVRNPKTVRIKVSSGRAIIRIKTCLEAK